MKHNGCEVRFGSGITHCRSYLKVKMYGRIQGVVLCFVACFVLRCVVMCCVKLRCVVLCCGVVCYVVLFWIALCCVALLCVVFCVCCVGLCCVRCVVLCRVVMCCAASRQRHMWCVLLCWRGSGSSEGMESVF